VTLTTAAMRNLAERISDRAAQLDTSRIGGVVLEHRAAAAVADLRRLADEVDALARDWESKA
jgi:hypothetical protein